MSHLERICYSSTPKLEEPGTTSDQVHDDTALR